jgi:DNA ligase-1
VRTLPFRTERRRLEKLVAGSLAGRHRPVAAGRLETSDDLMQTRSLPPVPIIEGLMLKRWDSVYEPGRPKGPWFKWKRDPYTVDCVLMYAQRGNGKRSSFYSDYTFGSGRRGRRRTGAGGKGLFRASPTRNWSRSTASSVATR